MRYVKNFPKTRIEDYAQLALLKLAKSEATAANDAATVTELTGKIAELQAKVAKTPKV